jgi:hypothetical protein
MLQTYTVARLLRGCVLVVALLPSAGAAGRWVSKPHATVDETVFSRGHLLF